MIPFYKTNLTGFDISKFQEMIDSGQVTNWGKYHKELESLVQEYLGTNVCFVASGTHAITLSLLALRHFEILPPNARILIPSFTFVATIQAILNANMVPILCDIESDTWTMDISKSGGKFDAIMPVNIFGVQPTNWSNYITIGDLSHGFGGNINGLKNGTQQTIAAFSTSVTKPFQTVEGGLVSSPTKEFIDYIKLLRRWGMLENYDCITQGQWSKISELHCAIGIHSFKHLEESIQKKNQIAQWYKDALGNKVVYQTVPVYTKSTYKDFGILIPGNRRNKVANALHVKDIGYKFYFSPAIHQMTYFKSRYIYPVLSYTTYVADNIICLPIHDFLTQDEVGIISDTILGVL